MTADESTSTGSTGAAGSPPREVVFGPGPVFLRWTPAAAAEYPELVEEVAQFDAGQRDAAQQAVSWLRERSLLVPAESVARLLLDNGRLRGFYALASGSGELTVSQRRELGGGERRTQPATLLSQIARDIRAPAGTGGVLILHAVAVSRRGARQIAATMFTLDPYDSDTAEMWKRSYGFRDSAAPGPGADELRLWIPLEQ
jgi:hypothetical protein